MKTLLFVFTFFNYVFAQPDHWWLSSKGIHVKNFQHYKDLMMQGPNGEYYNKHVFLDFFMETCHFCYEYQGQWNALVDKMKDLYGDQVAFFQINKSVAPEIVRKYGARRYPCFYYVKPETNAKVATRFTAERNYEEMYRWMNKLITVHGGIKYGEEEELLNIHTLEEEDEDLQSEEEIQFEGYDLKKMSAENAKNKNFI